MDKIIAVVSSPLSLFTLIILVCNAVFAICATKLRDKDSFKYCIHMFLAIVFFFGTIVLWSPAYLYPPSEVKQFNLQPNPLAPTVCAFAGVIIYMYYQWRKLKFSVSKSHSMNHENGSCCSGETSSK